MVQAKAKIVQVLPKLCSSSLVRRFHVDRPIHMSIVQPRVDQSSTEAPEAQVTMFMRRI